MKKTLSLLMALVMLLSIVTGFGATAQAAQITASGTEIVAYAQKYEGYPYVWGTHGPDSFDCSGFVHYVFAHFGYNLPYSSSEYWNNPTKYGTVVGNNSVANALPGDVISWNGHVAIYIGNGKTVEALGAKWGVVNNYPITNHSNKTYQVIRIYGVTFTSYDEGSELATDNAPVGWQKIDGKWYYYNADGTAKRFWNKINGVWYYMNTYGEMQTGWKKIGGVWYYFKSSGAMVTYLQTINGKKYYFNGSGAMQEGWIDFSDGKHYFLDGDGAMQTEWTTVDGKTYYLGKTGVMVKYLQTIENEVYYFYGNGIRLTGWLKMKDNWYYFSSEDGTKQTGWVEVKGKTYYLDENGVMLKYLQEIEGKKYYFYGSGARFTGWLKVKDNWYYFSPTDGAMVTGTQKIGSKTYSFDDNGVWLS